MTGVGALIFLTPYIWLWETLAPGALLENAEIALVGFHSSFNFLGVVLVLPFTYRFARFVQRVVPEGGDGYTDSLDRALLREPQLALNAVQDCLFRQLNALLNHVGAILGVQPHSDRANLTVLQAALDETLGYVDRIHLKEGDGEQWERLLAIYHTLDHMQRLHERCEEEEDRAVTARESVELEEVRGRLSACLPQLYAAYLQNQWIEAAELAAENYSWVAGRVEPLRAFTVEQVAQDAITVAIATDRMEAIRWLERVSRHLARINHHLATAMMAVGRS
jgi:phosphate:Na+ symporter